jgi:hypothetical protein
MADLYRLENCVACGKPHHLFDTSIVRYPSRGNYSYTCPVTKLLVTIRLEDKPETVTLPSNSRPTPVWSVSSLAR